MTRISRLLALFAGCLAIVLLMGPVTNSPGQDKKDEKKGDKK